MQAFGRYGRIAWLMFKGFKMGSDAYSMIVFVFMARQSA